MLVKKGRGTLWPCNTCSNIAAFTAHISNGLIKKDIALLLAFSAKGTSGLGELLGQFSNSLVRREVEEALRR
jgi:hypothetical protein